MGKFSKRVKRYFSPLRGRIRNPRPKTFATEEAANAWAEEQGFKTFKLENMKSSESTTKKIRVVAEI